MPTVSESRRRNNFLCSLSLWERATGSVSSGFPLYYKEMPNRFPDIPGEAMRSGRAVWNVMAQTSGHGIVDSGVNKITHGLVETAKQSILFPFNVLVRPVAGTVSDLVRAAGRETLAWTGLAIRSIPWIPMPGRLGNGYGPSPTPDQTLALPHESIAPPPAFHGPGDLGLRPRTDAPSSDAQPRSP